MTAPESPHPASLITHPSPSRAALGWADLIRAWDAGGPDLLSAAAALLELAPVAGITAALRFDARAIVPAQVAVDFIDFRDDPVESWSEPIPPLTHWYAATLDTLDPSARPAPPAASAGLPAWTDRPAPARAAPLARWESLLPRLRRALALETPGRAPDVPRILRRLARGEHPAPLPRVGRRRWGAPVQVIEDRARRLTPYWADQSRLARHLLRLFPRHALDLAVVDEGLDLPARLCQSGVPGAEYRPPPPGGALVVLGDLGALGGGPRALAFWAGLGRRAREAGARAVAVVPLAPRGLPAGLGEHWTAVGWERDAAVLDRAALNAQAERLLAALAVTARVEPGLLRDLRRLLGLDIAAESALWQHPAVSSPSSVAATIRPSALRERRPAFDTLDAPRRRAFWERVRAWRADLPEEVYLAEALQLGAQAQDLLSAPELDLLARFFAALSAQLTGPPGTPMPDWAADWFRRLESRSVMAGAVWADPGVCRLWAAVHAEDPDAEPPPGLDPALIEPAPGAPDLVLDLVHGGPDLHLLPPATGTGSPLARISTRNRLVIVRPLPSAPPPRPPVGWVERSETHRPPPPGSAQQPPGDDTPHALRLTPAAPARVPLPLCDTLEVRTDLEVLRLRRAPRPPWASAMGRDRHGLWADLTLDTGRAPPVVQRLRWVPPGRFAMGSPADEPGRWDDEGPRHPVTIAAGFWLFDTPCTQALWQAVMGKNPSQFKDPRRPVEQVSWEDVTRRFLPALAEHCPGFVLPTEAQWEYACRAGTDTALYSGPIEILGDANAPALDPIAWYGGNSGQGFELDNGRDRSEWLKEIQDPQGKAGTHPVRGKAPNAWGLYDMLGNVWEWVQDPWHDDYRGAPADGSAWEDAATGAGRVIRGGAWDSKARRCRCASRDRYSPVNRNDFLGFRCARVQEA